MANGRCSEERWHRGDAFLARSVQGGVEMA